MPRNRDAVFFFQAEDGIRDVAVTGVQTCALPISFFVQAENIRKRLDGWKKAVAEGHEIGNHSNTHPCTANYSFSRLNALENYTLEMMAAQLDGANAEIEIGRASCRERV